MKKIILSSILTAALSIQVSAYDAQKAESFNNFFSKMTQKACANSKLFIEAEETLKLLNEGKKFTYLDIRTRGEESIITLSAKNSIFIPIEDLFKKESLDKLPKDEPIMILCHSGTRATMAAMSLKQIGFKQARVVKGGLVALADANNPKNAPMK